MEVLVTGGNGFVGHHLIGSLLERGDRVRVLALPGEDVHWLEDHGVGVHRGDICQPETLTAAIQGAEGVVHLAAMMHVWRPLSEYRAVNVDGTENVCRAALSHGVDRVVHMSSSSVYGLRWRRPVDESFPLLPFNDPYPVSKAEADLAVQRMISEAGLPAVIIRPDQIFGPGDRLHFAATADRLRRQKGVVVGRGDNTIPLVYVSDIVQGLVLALDNPRAVGQAFNISAPQPVTQSEYLNDIARAVGAKSPTRHIPYRPLYAASWGAERIAGLARTFRRPPITRLGVAFLAADVRFSIDKARRDLDYRPQISIAEGVRLTADWYDRQGTELLPRRSLDITTGTHGG